MMTYQQREDETPKPAPEQSFATVGTVYADGLGLIFDGEETESAKNYKCNAFIPFKAGQRVRIIKDSGTYVVEYPVGNPAAGLEADNASYADRAGHATSADTATQAESAYHAASAASAETAKSAQTAVTAENANNALTAQNAQNSVTSQACSGRAETCGTAENCSGNAASASRIYNSNGSNYGKIAFALDGNGKLMFNSEGSSLWFYVNGAR